MVNWHALDADDRAAVLSLPHTVRSFQPHHYIVREYDRATHSCVLHLKGDEPALA